MYSEKAKNFFSLIRIYELKFVKPNFLDFRNWWPGWNGEKAGNPAFNFDSEDFLGISMKRKFDFVKSRQNTQVTVERFIDYYFWGLQNLQSKLPFLCERTKKDIGCVQGLLKFMFSKKATKNYKIFTIDYLLS